MGFNPTTWVDFVTYFTATQGNRLEQGIVDAYVGQTDCNVVAASGSTLTLPVNPPASKVTLSANCTFTFTAPTSAACAFSLYVSGAFTVTWPASVKWDSGAPPTYTSPAAYVFQTWDSGVTWLGSQVARAIA